MDRPPADAGGLFLTYMVCFQFSLTSFQ